VTTEATWRKSRRSQNNATCVEVRSSLDQVRDSKNPAGPSLRVDASALIDAIQAGRFDR
jgi:hypothetical protein